MLLFLKVPVFISILSGSMAYFYLTGGPFTKILGQRVLAGVREHTSAGDSVFICAGCVYELFRCNQAGYGILQCDDRALTGGLAQVNVLLSTLMGGLSGKQSG